MEGPAQFTTTITLALVVQELEYTTETFSGDEGPQDIEIFKVLGRVIEIQRDWSVREASWTVWLPERRNEVPKVHRAELRL